MKAFGRDVAIYGGADLLFKLLQFALIPVYTRELTVAEFGVLALLQVSATLVGAIANLGVNFATQRFYFDPSTGGPQKGVLVSTGLFQLVATLTLTVGALIVLAHPFEAQLQANYGIAWLLLVIALVTIVPDQLAQYLLDTSRLQFAPLRFCAIALVKNVLGLLIGVWLLLEAGLGLMGLFLGNLVGATLAVPIGAWLVRQDLTFAFDRALFKRTIRFGAPFVFTAAGYWAFSSMDRWLLAELADPVQVGLFSIALKFASVMALVITAFHQAWVPWAMRLAHEEPDHPRIFSKVLNFWVFLLGLMSLAIGLFAAEILSLFTPRAYWPAAAAMAVGAAGVALSGTTQLTTLGLTLAKRTGLIATGAWLAAGINLAANLILIPPLGATGSALATCVSYAALTLFYGYWSQRLYPMPVNRRHVLYGSVLIALTPFTVMLPADVQLVSWGLALKLGLLLVAALGGLAIGVIDPALLRSFASASRTQTR